MDRDGRPAVLGGPQPRRLLAALLVDPGRPVNTDTLVDVLWGERPPPTAAKTIQKYISQLRKELGESIVTHPGGYLLAVAPDRVDAGSFKQLLDQAAQAPAPERAKLLQEALSLWRGQPFGEFEHQAFTAERARLEEERLSATEDLMDVELALGHHGGLVGRLEEAVIEHPLRERLWAKLMLALYRSGRQADALRAYQRLRTVLGEELGIEPSADLQELESRLLLQDPGLAATEAGPPVRLPRGTVTFLITDIEGSTALWEEQPGVMPAAIARHDQLIRSTVTSHGGHVVKGLGDGMLAAFESAQGALAAALDLQLGLQEIEVLRGRVRLTLHSGEADLEAEDDYFGVALSRSARLVEAGHGGQILLSGSTRALIGERLPEPASIRDLGAYRLRGLSHPGRIYQLLHPNLAADFPPLRSTRVAVTNLPAQLTSFVGRARELTEIAELLSATRLVTLAGPGGSGKTRLALEAAADQVDHCRDGVWLVDLAPLTSPDEVPFALAGPLGVSGQPGRPTEAVLVDYLADKELLLLIDNCEHLVDKVADLGARLLQVAAGLRVLATSREPLEVAGEVTYEVHPLPVPDSEDGLAAIEKFDAVRLFVERARSADPHFQLTNANAAAVAQIRQRLDGMPLALELAAARLRTFSPEELTTLLDDRFRVLAAGPRTAPTRHQTLRAAVEWSYDLLSEPAGTLFRRLSVFRGGFALEAAEQVCGAEPLSSTDVLVLLPELVDKSLVVPEHLPTGVTRYRLLETLREYGRERLSSPEGEQVRDSHASYFLALAERAATHLLGPDQLTWMRRLVADYDNLRKALRWAFDQDREMGIRLATALQHYWDAVGPRLDAHEWLRRAVEVSETVGPELRIEARLAASDLFVSTQLSFSIRFAEEALEEARRLGDEKPVGRSLRALGWARGLQEEHEVAVSLGTEAVEIFRRLDDPWEIAWSLERLGQSEYQDTERSIGYLLESLALYRKLGDRRRTALVLYKLAETSAQARRDLDAAEEWVEESLAISDELGSAHDTAHALLVQGRIVRMRGHRERAREILEVALERLRGLGDQRCRVRALSALGIVLAEGGDSQRAIEVLQEGLELGQTLDEKRIARNSLAGMAGLLASGGRTRDAVILYAAADRLTRQLKFPVAEKVAATRSELVDRLRTQMDPSAFDSAWEAGQRMSLSEAVTLALAARVS